MKEIPPMRKARPPPHRLREWFHARLSKRKVVRLPPHDSTEGPATTRCRRGLDGVLRRNQSSPRSTSSQ